MLRLATCISSEAHKGGIESSKTAVYSVLAEIRVEFREILDLTTTSTTFQIDMTSLYSMLFNHDLFNIHLRSDHSQLGTKSSKVSHFPARLQKL